MGMDNIEPRTLAEIIASTSTSKLAGLLAADPAYKGRAAERLARDILYRLNQPQPDRNQLNLHL
ncbi:hypothetical protein ASE73_07625 [Sphingomonas sp. Leaf24]|nr:hypothetical protein ASE50_16735 [Sphingomonas sp. Leaf5]KQM89445.1 hypothetical protein ASE73_07625 [Sphingomonas sp. Leaf24]